MLQIFRGEGLQYNTGVLPAKLQYIEECENTMKKLCNFFFSGYFPPVVGVLASGDKRIFNL